MTLLFLGHDFTQDESRRGGVAIPNTSKFSPGEHVRVWCTFFIVAMFVSLHFFNSLSDASRCCVDRVHPFLNSLSDASRCCVDRMLSAIVCRQDTQGRICLGLASRQSWGLCLTLCWLRRLRTTALDSCPVLAVFFLTIALSCPAGL